MSFENTCFTVKGAQVVVPQAASIMQSYGILADKKAADADRLKASAYLRNVRLSDNGDHYAKLLMGFSGNTKIPFEPVDALFANVIAQAIQTQDKMLDVKELFTALPEYAKQTFINRGVNRIGVLYNIKIDDKQMNEMLNNGNLVLYEYLCFGVAVAVKKGTDKQGNPTVSRTYITRNLNTILYLALNGYIKGVSAHDVTQEWIDEKLNILFGKTADKNLIDGKATVFVLRPESDGTAKPSYNLTKRQAPLVLAGEDGLTVYPIETYRVFADATSNILQTGVFNVSYVHTDGTKDNVVLTLSKDATVYSYEEIDPLIETYYNAFVMRGLLGWRPSFFGLNAISLTKDTFSTFGIAVDKFDAISAYDKVNKRNVHIEALHRTPENFKDAVAARMVFTTVVSNMVKRDYALFAEDVPELSAVALRRDMRDVLLRWANDLSDEDLYNTLDKSKYAPLFKGSLKERCTVRRKNMPRYLKKFTALDIGTTDLRDRLKAIMDAGVLHVVYSTSSGRFQVLNLTTNKQILQKTYGKHYIAEWETPIVKLNYVRRLLQDVGKDYTIEQCTELLHEYDLYNTIFHDGVVGFNNAAELIDLIGDAQQRLGERQAARATTNDSNSLTGKIADGVGFDTRSKSLSYYRTIKLMQVIYLSYSRLEDTGVSKK